MWTYVNMWKWMWNIYEYVNVKTWMPSMTYHSREAHQWWASLLVYIDIYVYTLYLQADTFIASFTEYMLHTYVSTSTMYTYPRGRWHIEVHLRCGNVKLWVIGIQEGWVCVVSVLDLGVWKHVSLYTSKPWPYTCIHNIILHACTYATYMYWNWSLLKALSNLPSIETQDCSSFVKIADPTSALLPTNTTETYR